MKTVTMSLAQLEANGDLIERLPRLGFAASWTLPTRARLMATVDGEDIFVGSIAAVHFEGSDNNEALVELDNESEDELFVVDINDPVIDLVDWKFENDPK